ncbi:MAG: hypothetical protein JNL67_22125 [Planctomycetaceae bacterium]|nr:hypothetical protein [Planctomycetaceae bacterium]
MNPTPSTGSSRKKIWPKFVRAALVLGLIFLGIVFWGWAMAWRSLPAVTQYTHLTLPAEPMSGGYGDVIDTHARPYIIKVEDGAGSAMIYGIEHVKDPDAHELIDLREKLEAFGPTVVLIEGRLGFLPPLVADPVREFGESGFLYQWAVEKSLPVMSWELPLESEIVAATKSHQLEQAWLYFVLRPYCSNLRHGRPESPEAVLLDLIETRAKWPQFGALKFTIKDVDRIWSAAFPDRDWRDESDHDGLPGFLNQIAEQVSLARDVHLSQMILGLISDGQRVFVAAGSAHAVKIEPVMRAAYEHVELIPGK